MKISETGKRKRLIGDSYPADPDDLDKLRRLAKRTGVSKAEHIRRAVKQYLESVDEVEDEDPST